MYGQLLIQKKVVDNKFISCHFKNKRQKKKGKKNPFSQWSCLENVGFYQVFRNSCLPLTNLCFFSFFGCWFCLLLMWKFGSTVKIESSNHNHTHTQIVKGYNLNGGLRAFWEWAKALQRGVSPCIVSCLIHLCAFGFGLSQWLDQPTTQTLLLL